MRRQPKRNVRMQLKKKMIYWIGPGLEEPKIHSNANFLKRVHRAFPDFVYYRRKGDTEVPVGLLKRNDLQGWMRLANAHFVSKNRLG